MGTIENVGQDDMRVGGVLTMRRHYQADGFGLSREIVDAANQVIAQDFLQVASISFEFSSLQGVGRISVYGVAK